MAELKICGMASIPTRKIALKRAMESLLYQVDKMYIFLDGYKEVPKFLTNNKITVFRSQDFGAKKLGDAGKYLSVENARGYFFSVDDDIIYGRNYIAMLIKKIEQYKRKAVVGLHGIILPPKVRNYYRNRTVIWCKFANPTDQKVHLLGTGALAFHTSTLRVRLCDFKVPNMADIWFGILAQRQRTPMVCIARSKPLLKVQNLDYSDSIYTKKETLRYMTNAINTISWKIN